MKKCRQVSNLTEHVAVGRLTRGRVAAWKAGSIRWRSLNFSLWRGQMQRGEMHTLLKVEAGKGGAGSLGEGRLPHPYSCLLVFLMLFLTAIVWKHELFLLYSGNDRGGEKSRVLCSYDTVLDKLSHQDMVWDIDSKVILAKVHFLLKLKVELRILEFLLVINKKKVA